MVEVIVRGCDQEQVTRLEHVARERGGTPLPGSRAIFILFDDVSAAATFISAVGNMGGYRKMTMRHEPEEQA